MNCADLETWVHRYLDGEVADFPPEIAGHLESCVHCRSFHNSLFRLEKGLAQRRAMVFPQLPNKRIVQMLLEQNRATNRARFKAYLALAASLLLAIGAAFYISFLNSGKTPNQSGSDNIVQKNPPKNDQAELPRSPRESLVQASEVMNAWSQKAKTETLHQAQIFLPQSEKLPLPDLNNPVTFQGPSESLLLAGKGVSDGLEPLANSAKRGLDLLLGKNQIMR